MSVKKSTEKPVKGARKRLGIKIRVPSMAKANASCPRSTYGACTSR